MTAGTVPVDKLGEIPNSYDGAELFRPIVYSEAGVGKADKSFEIHRMHICMGKW